MNERLKRFIKIVFIFIIISVSHEIFGKNNKKGNRKKSVLHLLKILPDFKLKPASSIKFNDKNYKVYFFALKFAQGNAVYVEILKKRQSTENNNIIGLYYGKQKIPLTRFKWGYRGFIGISPNTRPGIKRFVFKYKKNKQFKNFLMKIRILKTSFPVFKKPLDLGKFSDTRRRTPEEIAYIKESAKKKRKAFKHRGKDLFSGKISHPRDMHYITSRFWSKRIYMRYKIRNKKKVRLKNSVSVHRGLDFRGKTGTPVFSIARGEVVLADKLYYEGNMVIIDHGNRIFSYFMHMNSLETRKGDIVNPGDLIGRVGSTGVSTAAHLHVAFLIRGVFVDPLSVMALPVRD